MTSMTGGLMSAKKLERPAKRITITVRESRADTTIKGNADGHDTELETADGKTQLTAVEEVEGAK